MSRDRATAEPAPAAREAPAPTPAAAPSPPAATLAAVIGNRAMTAVAGRLARDVTDKHSDAAGTLNAGTTEVFGCQRVPLEGLTSTTADPSMKDRDGKTDIPTTESAAGKAVAVLPNALLQSFRDAATGAPGPVDLLVYLHGMNIGMRERKGSEPLNVRDANVDLVEAQLNIVSSTGRRIMGLMPQGTTTAGFGGKGGFNPDAFVREAMGALVGLKHLPEMPPIGRFILAGHSGGGNEMAGEMDADPAKSRLPAQFAPGAGGGSPNVEMLTFDAINQDGQEDKHIAWIKQMAGLDATAMNAMPDDHARLEYLDRSARWVGFCTNSTYTPRYIKIQAAIAEVLGPKGAAKDVSAEVVTRWRQNYRAELPKGDQSNDHNLLVGEKLAEGLETGEGAKSMHRRRVYFSANGRNMPGMLNLFDGYKKRGELEDLAGEQAQNDLRQPMWGWPRIQYAMDTVAERVLPSVVPDDVSKTGQVDEATDWLKTHGGKAPPPAGAAARLARAILARDPIVDGIDLGPLYAAQGVDIAKLKGKLKTVKFLGAGVTINGDLVAPLKAVEDRITAASGKHAQSISSLGGFNMRTRRGSTTLLSDHAFGRAIDINSATNVMFRQQISPPNTGTADAPKRDFDGSAASLARLIQAVTTYGTFPAAPEKAADGTVDPVAQARYEKEKQLFASGADVTALTDPASLRAASELFKASYYDAWPGEIKTAVGTRKKELEAARKDKATTVAYLEEIVKGLTGLSADIDAVGGAFALKQLAKSGFMDLEEYVVEAFLAEGFRWGGQWGGPSRDFMHFEYGSPASDR